MNEPHHVQDVPLPENRRVALQQQLFHIIKNVHDHRDYNIIQRMEQADIVEVLGTEYKILHSAMKGIMERIPEPWSAETAEHPNQRLKTMLNTNIYVIIQEISKIAFDALNHMVDQDRNTILHYAAYSDNHLVAQRLLNARVNMSYKNIVGLTPLEAAVASKSTRVFELLLRHGAPFSHILNSHPDCENEDSPECENDVNCRVRLARAVPGFHQLAGTVHLQMQAAFETALSRLFVRKLEQAEAQTYIMTIPSKRAQRGRIPHTECRFNVDVENIHAHGCNVQHLLVFLPMKWNEERRTFSVQDYAVPFSQPPFILQYHGERGKRLVEFTTKHRNYGAADKRFFLLRPYTSNIIRFEMERSNLDFDFVAVRLIQWKPNSPESRYCSKAEAVHPVRRITTKKQKDGREMKRRMERRERRRRELSRLHHHH